jgi:uncharacterized 2Fe-2S/4Fe-4S cluster protein (DUF4445 family)
MKKTTHRIVLLPTRTELTAPHGTPLRDLLFEQGVEFPCGGHGRCRGCKVLVHQGAVGINEAQRQQLTPEELANGWRLSCQCNLDDDLVIELRQWDAAILTDETAFAFTPKPGLGVAVDLGTTTLVAQLLDCETGQVLAVRTALNAQARYGTDVMSRVQYAVAEGGQPQLTDVIRQQIGKLIEQLLRAAKASASAVTDVVLVGNTVMHHLFCGIDLEPLSHYPFQPVRDGLELFRASELGWQWDGNPQVRFLPCLGGFVGSDILGGILATKLHESEALVGLVDLGTNGEIVIGNRTRLLCASTAAGPAFEGARISTGMRAATGAIVEVSTEGSGFNCRVLGNVEPRGICGSGLVDAVAAGLDLGLINASGRLPDNNGVLVLCPPVTLTQQDIRELQLAKGAIAAGIEILLGMRGAAPADLQRLYLAGAFGNYINRQSALRIGLLNFPLEKVRPAGNTALLGAKIALFSLNGEDGSFASVRRRIEHVMLSADPAFQDTFVEQMSFPA